MKVSLDGGLTWQESDGVRVIYEDMITYKEDSFDEIEAELHLNLTDEGLITDVWEKNGDNLYTASEMAQEIVDKLEDKD